MKVLLINPELPPNFWSFKQTLKLTNKKALGPPLGLITVAALLPPHWELRLADLNTRPLTQDDWDFAEMVMLSGMVFQRDPLRALIREAKLRNKIVVVGGPYATSLSQEVLDAGPDFLVRGEAENTLPRFLAALAAGEQGGVFEEDGKPDMTCSPAPRFDLLRLEDYDTMGVQTSRGCPFNCEFCDVVNLYGRKPRYKTPNQVISELEVLYRLGWRRGVFFCDDNFVGYQAQARAVLERLIPWMKSHGEPFSFWTQASVNLGQDREMVDLLTEANFAFVFIGVESPDQESLTLSRKHHNVKAPMGQSLTNIYNNGLPLMASFIIGFDGEQAGAGDRICDFVEENHIPLVMLNMLTPIPNTALCNRLLQEDRLRKFDFGTTGDFNQDLKMAFIPTRPEKEVVQEYLRAVDLLYEPSRFLARAHRAYLNIRPTRSRLAEQKGVKLVSQGPKHHPPLGQSLRDLMALAQMAWWHGIKAPYRWRFWKQTLEIWRKNPSRIRSYLICMGLGENLSSLRQDILNRAAHLGITR
jgi:radical SAM superfamily enzyme YgiQ (UPF0313 family)